MLSEAVNQTCYTIFYDALSSNSSLIKLNFQLNVAEASDYRTEASIQKDNASQYRKNVVQCRMMHLLRKLKYEKYFQNFFL